METTFYISYRCEPPKEYKSVFDNVIVLENDESKDADWKIENRWKAYDPFPMNILLF